MILPVSEKQASFAPTPHIKKGYYPAKLLAVKPFADKDGNLIKKQYGKMLIFEFGIYPNNVENPTKALTTTRTVDGRKIEEDVVLNSFVYHLYVDKKTGEDQTAVTPNSAITKLLKALGWVFDPKGVDIDKLIGNWVEVNVNDYEKTVDGKQIMTSSIQGVGKLENAAKVKEDNKEMSKAADEPAPAKASNKRQELHTMLKEGLLTQKAYDDAIESLEAKEKKGA